ncbi:MAG: SDR family oxidoreductase [Planctomycetales bacterium]|nr:SDR family oxidoreductase [Planctomycetales bacterium]
MVSDYLLLTGVTGLLGRYLLRDLLLQGRRLAVIARPNRKQTAEQRVEELVQFWEQQIGQLLPRPVVLEGDICESYLGLDAASRDWVAQHCSVAMHSAASLTFHEDAQGEPYRSNIGGLTHMLQLCKEASITDLHYISTAYVAGLREDLVLEHELQAEQAFRNDYERSKFQGELLVRAADFIETLTVYRPAVIAGDSQTGYTNTYHGLYLYLKLMSVLVRNTEPGPDGVRDTPVQFALSGDEERNVVPVDWVSAVICHLLDTPAAHGNTFHLAPEVPLTPRQIIEAGYRYYNSRGVEFTGAAADTRQPISEIDRTAHENIGMYKEYESSDPKFDLTNVRKFAAHLPCPVIDEAMLHRFLRYGEDDRWGKRKPPRNCPCASVEAYCRSQLVEETADSTGDALAVNLHVLGPGGGDWQLLLRDGQLVHMQAGSFVQAAASFSLDSHQFWSLTEPQEVFPWVLAEQYLQAPPATAAKVLEQLSAAMFNSTATHSLNLENASS